MVSLLSSSQLSVSGPAAGLTAICAMAIQEMGSVETLFVSVALSGVVQILLGVFRLGGFTHLIPSAVIKGMLAAIGIILMSKQIPLLIGYGQPDFWTNELFNILTLNHAWQHITGYIQNFTIEISKNVIFLNKKSIIKYLDKIPEYSVVTVSGSDSKYFDHDILEIFQDFKLKARAKHIELHLVNIPEVQTIEIH